MRETVRLLGVPLRSGSLYPGNENDARGYRDAGVTSLLSRAGVSVVDEGDLAIPSYLPHHSIPPLRNWPGPRIVWDLIAGRIGPYFTESNQLPLLLGCDCSVVVGTAHAMAALGEVHVIYIDGDFDDAPPDAAVARSGAAAAVWLLTHESPFSKSSIQPENVTVIGWSNGPFDGSSRAGSVSLKEAQGMGARKAIDDVLRRIPRDAAVLVHFDIDVVRESELPAAYFPLAEGLSLEETGEIVDAVLSDPRVRLIEVSEYAALRDPGAVCARKIADLLAHGLDQRP